MAAKELQPLFPMALSKFPSPSQKKSTRSHPAHLAGLLATSLAATILSSSAQSMPLTCEQLFATQSTQRVQTALQFDLSALNEPSQEFLIRLRYLLQERHLISDEILPRLIASDRLINPLGANSNTTHVKLYPHQAAFAHLLQHQEELQWDLIRQALKPFVKTLAGEKEKAQAATVQTEEVLIPIAMRGLPFWVEHFIQTETGKTLAVAVSSRFSDKTTKVIAYELPSWTEVSSTPVEGAVFPNSSAVVADQGTALITLHLSQPDELVTVDLLAGKVLSHPPIGTDNTGLNNIDPSLKPEFIPYKGELTAAAFSRNSVVLINPRTGDEIDRVTLNEPVKFKSVHHGAIGDTIYVAGVAGPTHVIDLKQSKRIWDKEQRVTVGAFSYQGRNYGLAVDIDVFKDPHTSLSMRTFDLESGQESPRMVIDTHQPNLSPHERFWPRLIDTFESNGRLYGIIATDYQLALVDLIKGEIKKMVDQGPTGRRLKAGWLKTDFQQVGFNFDGRRYLLAILAGEKSLDPKKLAVIDALTLEPFGTPLLLDGDVTGIRQVPSQDKSIQVILNFTNGKSQLVSLVNRM